MSFNFKEYYEERNALMLSRRNLVKFVLGVVAFISSWIGFHFFNWTIVGTGLILFLGVIMFLTGGFDYVRESQNNTTVSRK